MLMPGYGLQGGLARFAAREFGVKVFGITLSKRQLKLARERVNAEGRKTKVDLQLLDYRDLPPGWPVRQNRQ